MEKKLTRRNLLKYGGIAGTMAMGTALTQGAYAHPIESKGVKWNDTFDVIVVGSGVAATVAALSALKGGANTVMLEKMSVPGGSSAISNATIVAVGSDLQQQKGIKDSPELFIKDLNTRNQGLNQPALTKKFAENCGEAYRFIKANGATFYDYLLGFGMSAPRVLQPTVNGEIGIMKPLRTRFLAEGGKLITRCVADEIIFENGAAIGVRARTNYRFDTRLESDYCQNTSGDTVYFRAKKGIICGTGGYSADKFFRKQEFPNLETLPTSQQEGATCSGWMLLQNAGARMIHSSLYQYSFPMSAYDMSFGFIVDPTTGKRVFDENMQGSEMAVVIANLLKKNGGHLPVALVDADSVEKYVEDKKQNETNIKAGFNSRHNSIEEFAAHYSIPLTPLKKTFEDYNRYVTQGKDPEFNKNFDKIDNVQVKTLPFYSMVARPNFNYCLGGALITPDAQVMSAVTGMPITGLYAAGEATGGVFGAGRMSGCSIGDGCTFGMIAGRHAAARKI